MVKRLGRPVVRRLCLWQRRVLCKRRGRVLRQQREQRSEQGQQRREPEHPARAAALRQRRPRGRHRLRHVCCPPLIRGAARSVERLRLLPSQDHWWLQTRRARGPPAGQRAAPATSRRHCRRCPPRRRRSAQPQSADLLDRPCARPHKQRSSERDCLLFLYVSPSFPVHLYQLYHICITSVSKTGF